NPLNAMLGWARLLRMGVLGPEETAQAVEAIERNADIQSQLITDLLDVSRIITGKMLLEIGRVNLVNVVHAALDSVRFAAESKGLRIERRLDSTVAEVMGDAARLQQCVWNLLSNAVKFTPPGGQVEVRLERCGQEICVAVRDTGQGIRRE